MHIAYSMMCVCVYIYVSISGWIVYWDLLSHCIVFGISYNGQAVHYRCTSFGFDYIRRTGMYMYDSSLKKVQESSSSV